MLRRYFFILFFFINLINISNVYSFNDEYFEVKNSTIIYYSCYDIFLEDSPTIYFDSDYNFFYIDNTHSINNTINVLNNHTFSTYKNKNQNLELFYNELITYWDTNSTLISDIKLNRETNSSFEIVFNTDNNATYYFDGELIVGYFFKRNIHLNHDNEFIFLLNNMFPIPESEHYNWVEKFPLDNKIDDEVHNLIANTLLARYNKSFNLDNKYLRQYGIINHNIYTIVLSNDFISENIPFESSYISGIGQFYQYPKENHNLIVLESNIDNLDYIDNLSDFYLDFARPTVINYTVKRKLFEISSIIDYLSDKYFILEANIPITNPREFEYTYEKDIFLIYSMEELTRDLIDRSLLFSNNDFLVPNIDINQNDIFDLNTKLNDLELKYRLIYQKYGWNQQFESNRISERNGNIALGLGVLSIILTFYFGLKNNIYNYINKIIGRIKKK